MNSKIEKTFFRFNKTRAAGAALVGAAALVGTQAANAAAQAAVDVADVTGTLTNQVSSITGVGIGILVLAGLVTAIAFVRKAASGR